MNPKTIEQAATEYANNPKNCMPGFVPMGRTDDAFLSGAQFMQPEIDRLRKQLDVAKKSMQKYVDHVVIAAESEGKLLEFLLMCAADIESALQSIRELEEKSRV